jgi:DNA-binding winged helix-turn-helix (wHTH) protein/tetratricopeptide (TPR) repeat protein
MVGENEKIYEFADFRLIPGEGLLLNNGTPINLNPKAFGVLALLVERHGHLVTKSEIINAIWDDAFIEEGAVSKAVWIIRNALGDISKERFIQTVPRRGYRFVAPVSVVGGSGAFRVSDLTGIDNKDEFERNEPALPATAAKSFSNRSKVLQRTIALLLLVTAATFWTYLLYPYAPFRTAEPAGHPTRGTTAAADPAKSHAPAPQVASAAEDAYFKGVYYFDTATNTAKRSEKNALFSKAVSEFQRAIRIDTRYAEAYAALARTYHWTGSSNGNAEAYAKSKAAAMTAIQLDPSNAKARASLAWVYWRYEWDWVRAEEEYKQALTLTGGTAAPLGHGYAIFISAQGRHDEAIDIMRRHEESSPLSIAGKMSSAYIKLRARNYDGAEVDFRRVLELDSRQDFALSGLGVTLTCLARFDEAIAAAQRANSGDDNPAQRLTLAWIYARAGRVKEARELLAKAERGLYKGAGDDPFAIAKVYAGLDEIDEAYKWLEKAFTVRSQYLIFRVFHRNWITSGAMRDSVKC